MDIRSFCMLGVLAGVFATFYFGRRGELAPAGLAFSAASFNAGVYYGLAFFCHS